MRVKKKKKKKWCVCNLPMAGMQALSHNRMLLCDYSPREQCLLSQSCP